MDNRQFFYFKSDISKVSIPKKLNNPFSNGVPKIAKIAAEEFQAFIPTVSDKWDYDFRTRNGKMFGILVVQRKDSTIGYLGTNSGRLSRAVACDRFVPSIFDDATDDYFINRGMTAITVIGEQIKNASNEIEIRLLKEQRRLKSLEVQKQLFESYSFLNLHGVEKNLLQIFEDSSHGKPPSATGECAAPKLLQYAFHHNLKPIAIAEFWWGNPINGNDKVHKDYHPACKDRCRPILEYMLDDQGLYEAGQAGEPSE